MKKRSVSLVLIMTMILVMLLGTTGMAYTNVIGTTGSRGANIRASASTSSDIVGSVSPNARFTICGEVSGSDGYTWYLVFVNKDQTGYVRADVVTNTGTAAGGETPNSLATGGSTGSTGGTTGSTGGTTGGTTGTGDAPVEEPAETVDCTLGLLTIEEGTLEPEFSPEVYEYTLTVPETTENVTVYAVPTDAESQIQEELGFYNLQVGANDRYITVEGKDSTTAVYHFNIIRGEIIPTPEATPEVVAPTEGDTTDVPDDTTVQTKSTGVSRWIVILLVLVIVVLVLGVVFMALQMRDMKEQIAALEREKRRRRKKSREMHTISTDTDGGTGGRRETRAVPPIQKNAYRIKPDIPAPPVRETARPEAEQPMYEEPVSQESLYAEPTYDNTVYEEQPEAQQNYVEPEYAEPEYAQPEYAEQRYTEPEYTEPAFADPAMSEQDNAEEGYFEENDSEEKRFAEAAYTAPQRESIRTEEPTQEDREGWKSVNFLAPEDDMEFEFLNLDEDEKG